MYFIHQKFEFLWFYGQICQISYHMKSRNIAFYEKSRADPDLASCVIPHNTQQHKTNPQHQTTKYQIFN